MTTATPNPPAHSTTLLRALAANAHLLSDRSLADWLAAENQAYVEAARQEIARRARAREADDAERWAGVQLAPPPETTTLTTGPYRGFRVQAGTPRPDPARAAHCRAGAEQFRGPSRPAPGKPQSKPTAPPPEPDGRAPDVGALRQTELFS